MPSSLHKTFFKREKRLALYAYQLHPEKEEPLEEKRENV